MPLSPPAFPARSVRADHPSGAAGSLRRPLAAAVASSCAFWLLPVAAAVADVPDQATWTATVDGQVVAPHEPSPRVRLDQDRPARVAVRLENGSAQPVEVALVRLEGRVLGLTYFSYTTRVDMKAPPGGSDRREFDLPLTGLEQQASGLVPATVTLLDPAANRLDEARLTADVDTSPASVLGLTSAAVLLLGVSLFVAWLARLRRGTLTVRDKLFVVTAGGAGVVLGVGAALVLTVLGWLAPTAAMLGAALAAGVGLAFAAGAVLPRATVPAAAPAPSAPEPPVVPVVDETEAARWDAALLRSGALDTLPAQEPTAWGQHGNWDDPWDWDVDRHDQADQSSGRDRRTSANG